jgi:uncharacterized protein YecT (DUF1311 family)
MNGDRTIKAIISGVGLSLGTVMLATTQAAARPAMPEAIAPPSASAKEPESVALGPDLGVAQPICVVQAEGDAYRCAVNWAKTADFFKSLVYVDLERPLSPSLRRQYAGTEKTWQQFQVQYCQQVSQALRHRPDHQLAEPLCRAELTNDRILELYSAGKVIHQGPAQNQSLNRLLRTLNLKEAPAQRQWQSYQTQHCQFEQRKFLENSDQLAQCRQRLTQSRIRQLEKLLDKTFAVSGAATAMSPVDATVGVAPLHCVEDTQLGLNFCAGYWSRTAEFLQSLVYGDLYTALSQPDQVGDRQRLAATDTAWQRYRQAHCEAVVAPFKGGSIVPMLHHRCVARLNNDRIADLKGMAPVPTSTNLETPELLAFVAELDKNQDVTQQLWNRYQSQHCALEPRLLRDSARREPCPARLRKVRLRQVNDMIRIR